MTPKTLSWRLKYMTPKTHKTIQVFEIGEKKISSHRNQNNASAAFGRLKSNNLSFKQDISLNVDQHGKC